MKIFETDRLILRRLTLDDAPFVLELLTDPSWLRYICDRGVRDLESACEYLRKGPLDMYARLGFGLYRIDLKDSGEPVGMCGLLKRDTLPDVDLGYALLPRHWGRGYASEAAAGVLAHARDTLGLKRVVAITSPDNEASGRVLERVGMRFERMIESATDPGGLKLFGVEFRARDQPG